MPIDPRRLNVEVMILSASGGLVYHARAMFGFKSWESTRRSVSELVSTWMRDTGCEHLILFGPSGGYLLAHDLFGAIDLTVIDPDEIASLIFRRRFPSSDITWHSRADLLPFTTRAPDDFFNFLISESAKRSELKTAVLFLGVLGQLDLHREDFTRTKAEATRLFIAALKKSGLPWASLHDLESADLPSAVPENFSITALAPTANLSTQSQPHLLPSTSSTARIAELNSALAKSDLEPKSWLDHETQWLGEPLKTIPWFLSRKRLHHLGWITNP